MLSHHKSYGLTIFELMLVVALISILVASAVPSYIGYIERTESDIAIKQIGTMSLVIDGYAFSNGGTYPASLSDVGLDGYEDPWGNTYKYTNIAQTRNRGKARKDRNLVPINSDYDLYSHGPDGRSVSPLTARHSRDDLVRANNGRFIGVAEDY